MNSFTEEKRLADRVVDGHQFGAVRKGGFDLDVMDHLCDAFHALVAADDFGPGFHHIRDRAPIAGTFDHGVSDQGNGLGVVQLDATRQTAAGDLGGHGNQRFVFFSGREVHVRSSSIGEGCRGLSG